MKAAESASLHSEAGEEDNAQLGGSESRVGGREAGGWRVRSSPAGSSRCEATELTALVPSGK